MHLELRIAIIRNLSNLHGGLHGPKSNTNKKLFTSSEKDAYENFSGSMALPPLLRVPVVWKILVFKAICDTNEFLMLTVGVLAAAPCSSNLGLPANIYGHFGELLPICIHNMLLSSPCLSPMLRLSIIPFQI